MPRIAQDMRIILWIRWILIGPKIACLNCIWEFSPHIEIGEANVGKISLLYERCNNQWRNNLSKAAATSITLISSLYSFLPFYSSSVIIGLISAERFLLICRPTVVKQTWVYQHRKFLYTILTMFVLGMPSAMVVMETLCFVLLSAVFFYVYIKPNVFWAPKHSDMSLYDAESSCLFILSRSISWVSCKELISSLRKIAKSLQGFITEGTKLVDSSKKFQQKLFSYLLNCPVAVKHPILK